MKKIHTQGFTLIETLIALAIMSMLVLSVANMMVAVSSQEKRTRAVAEVDTAASSILDDISQSLRNASYITTPATSSISTSTLVLNMSAIPAEHATTFAFANQALTATKGTSTPYRMHNANVLVTGVTFQNITASSTKGALRITLNVAYNNLANDAKLAYATTLITTVSLR